MSLKSGRHKLLLIKAKKQYNRYPGLFYVETLEHFLERNPRYKSDIPFKTIAAILYSIRTKPKYRYDDVWQLVKRSWPIQKDWNEIAAYGNTKTMNIKVIDFSVLSKNPDWLTVNYPHIRNYLLKELLC